MACCPIFFEKSQLPPTTEFCRHHPLTKTALLVSAFLFGGASAAFYFTGFSSTYTIAFGSLAGASLLGYISLCIATCRFTQKQFIDSLCQQNRKDIKRMADVMQKWIHEYGSNIQTDPVFVFLAEKIVQNVGLDDLPQDPNDFYLALFKASQMLSDHGEVPAILGIKMLENLISPSLFEKSLDKCLFTYFLENQNTITLFCKSTTNKLVWNIHLENLFDEEFNPASDRDINLLKFVSLEVIKIMETSSGKICIFNFQGLNKELAKSIGEKMETLIPSDTFKCRLDSISMEIVRFFIEEVEP